MEKKHLTADAFLADSWRLAAKVRASGWRPDVLIALWRGGAAVGVAVHEFLKASGWDVRHFPLKCKSYTGIGRNGEVEFTFGDETFGSLGRGERVLVVDDVFDSGRTAEAVKRRIEAVGAEMKIATVYWKRENNETSLSPDFFVADPGGEWLVFPHEIDGLDAGEIEEKDPALAALLAPFQQKTFASPTCNP